MSKVRSGDNPEPGGAQFPRIFSRAAEWAQNVSGSCLLSHLYEPQAQTETDVI